MQNPVSLFEHFNSLNIKLKITFLDRFANCSHNFTGPMTRNLKIQESSGNATKVIVLDINFSPSTHIFSGLGENFINLRILFIAKQPIKFVERQNFFGLQKLHQLSLYSNEIEFLHEDLLWDLPNLRILQLSDNRIMDLPGKLFMNLRDVGELSFDRNLIKTLASNIFSNNFQLAWLYTYNNTLKTSGVNFTAIQNVRLYNETSKSHFQRGKIVNY